MSTAMTNFLFIAAPLTMMSAAYLIAMQVGYMAGRAGDNHQLGIGALALCVGLMLTQAALWVLWGLCVVGAI